MSLESVHAQYIDHVRQFGKGALSALYPNDFTYSFLAIELVDSQGNIVDYFSWPVLPQEIVETHNETATIIRKSIGGVHVSKNSTFVPRQINIRGTFGRSFKILLGQTKVEFAGFGFSMSNGKFKISNPNFLSGDVPNFSTFAKTGYGCIKMLESMKDKSKQLDQFGKPHGLYLYNPILGNNYQVEVMNFRHWQDENAYNMLPAYSMQLTATADLSSIFGRINGTTFRNITFGSLQKAANSVASQLRVLK